ncbi:hypothetical protein F441_15868, partial [Phytophthora nicotianae CJ01A1]
DSVFVSGVYKWFRWLRYHSAYGVTSPEDEEEKEEDTAISQTPAVASLQSVHESQGCIELLSDAVCSSATAYSGAQTTAQAREYTHVGILQLDELQTFFRTKIK